MGMQDVNSGSTRTEGEGREQDGAQEEGEMQIRPDKLKAHLEELWGTHGPSESSLLGWSSWALPPTTWSVTGCGPGGKRWSS